MKNLTLTKAQRIEVFEIMKQWGFSANEFLWEEAESSFKKATVVSVAVYKGSPYYYRFDFQDHFQTSEYSPAYGKRISLHTMMNWKENLGQVQEWLGNLRKEVDTVDPWEAVSAEKAIFDAASQNSDNKPFSDAERQKALSAVKEIEDYLVKVHHIEADVVKPRMDYLVDASERLGKKDWKIVGMSIIVDIILNATVSPEAAREILRFASGLFQTIIGDPSGLLTS